MSTAEYQRVCVTGARDLNDYETVRRTLDTIHATNPIALIIHGAAGGADAFASHWAYERKVNIMTFPAQWGTHGAKAGPIRNEQMLRDGRPDLVVAFPGPSSRGTWQCVRKAESLGLKVQVVSS